MLSLAFLRYNEEANRKRTISMKILLTAINAKYIHSNLAVYSLRAYAKKYADCRENCDIGLAEYTINHSVSYILEGIYKEKPDVLCFSCYIWNMSYVEELIEEFHKLCPSVPIWVGGPEVSYEVEVFLQAHPGITGVMIGEGEKTFCRLCDYYGEYFSGKQDTASEGAEHTGLGQVAGIAYCSGGRVVYTAAQEPLDMSTIPFCYDKIEDFKNRIIYYESSRGCPFSCSYCLSSVDKKLRFRSLALVKQELEFFIEGEAAQVKFVDRTFNCNHEHAMKIWNYIKEHDSGITNFHFEVSADLLTKEELDLIGSMRPGLIQLEIGVQSTNEATIAEIHRTMRLERLKEVVREVQSHGNIHEHLDLIAGLPYEDYDTFAKSFDEIYALKPNQLQLGFLKVLKGSYMYEHAAEYGICYRSRPPYEVLKTHWLGFDEVLRIKQVEEMLEVYYNSGQFEVTMKLLDLLFPSAFAMFQQLGEFYERKGYFAMSHSRLRRSGILLEFMEEMVSTERFAGNRREMEETAETEGFAGNRRGMENILPMLRESLVFDLYYRENCKSRPGWAPEVSEWKAVTKAYCRNGKQSHVERFFYRFPGKEERTLKKLPDREKKPLYALFDYTDRDPLDYQARVNWVSPETRGE